MPGAAANLQAIIAWWEENRRELPWRGTRDPYAIWVAEVMSAQTQVERAASAWSAWMGRWPTVDALAGATLAEVLAEWQGLGYPRRARDLHRAARMITDGGWPDELTDLPGVGPYIAAAIRCFAFEAPVLPRDVNVTRVLERRFPAGLDTRRDPWRAGQAVMEFGQRICRVRPECSGCPVATGCDGPGPDAPGARPAPRPFAGSLRQRRGALLRRVLAEGTVALADADPQAAASLAADGLATITGAVVRPPGAGDCAAWSATSSVARSSSAARSRSPASTGTAAAAPGPRTAGDTPSARSSRRSSSITNDASATT